MLIARLTVVCVICLLAGCGSLDRADAAAAAKKQMIGMPREDVLACMGPPKKKATVDATEVWSYFSTDGSGSSSTDSAYIGHFAHASGSHDHSFCIVNIVMKNAIVKAVNYNGPTGGLLDKDEQCGYAISNCVTAGGDR